MTGILIYRRTGRPVKEGDHVPTFRGELVFVKGIVEPHNPSSTGRVIVSAEKEGGQYHAYFPSVIDATWIGRM